MAALLDAVATPQTQSTPTITVNPHGSVQFPEDPRPGLLLQSVESPTVASNFTLESNSLTFNSPSTVASVSVSQSFSEPPIVAGSASAPTLSLSESAGVTNPPNPDFTQVFSGLQQTGELTSVLHQQPQLVQDLHSATTLDLTAIAAGDVTADPESLRFQYHEEVGEAGVKERTLSKKQPPTVYREQDRFLPIANVARIMRNAIPKNGKVSKDAKECMQECVSEFVSFITSEACDKCAQEKRKTITGDDILFALATLGFDNYIEPLRLYLQRYREYTRSEKMATATTPRTATAVSGTPSDESIEQSSSGICSAASGFTTTLEQLYEA